MQNFSAIRPAVRQPFQKKLMGGAPTPPPPPLARVNPRPDGVWQVTRPDGGGGTKGPLRISGTNSWIGKIQTAFERSHRVAPDLEPLTSLT